MVDFNTEIITETSCKDVRRNQKEIQKKICWDNTTGSDFISFISCSIKQ